MYEKLSIREFGEHLLESRDLDPLYVALHGVKWDERMKKRWLVAYWCFYHAGVACYMAQQAYAEDFWAAMRRAAANVDEAPIGGRWPRAKERRHFRGSACVGAVDWLSQRSPESLVDSLAGANTMAELAPLVQAWPMFGPWISFKVADMLERCLGWTIGFQEAEVFMFKDPTEAALMLWRQHDKLPDDAQPKNKATRSKIISTVVQHLLEEFNTFGAPPRFDRPVGLQEVETILCKWKSHMRGHYPLNNDIAEISDGLEPWVKVSELAEDLLSAMPREFPAPGAP